MSTAYESPMDRVVPIVRANTGHTGLLAAILLILLAITRLPLAPKYLYYFDSVNFALSLEEFNPAKHQPQPPGYPLFVGLLKLLHFAIPSPEYVLLTAGLLVGTGALLLLWRLASSMFGAEAAYLAVALLIFNPPFWFGGITNQVRMCLALCSTGIALLAWRALNAPDSRGRLYLAFTVLGIAAGFRPALGALLLPLLLWTWWRTGRSVRRLIGCALLTGVAAIPWITATIVAVGGFSQWLALMWSYSNEQFRGSSAVFGARPVSAWKMAAQALVWNGLGALTWIWAAPFAPFGKEADGRKKGAFLAVWLLPIILFSAIIHIGDPDQALASVPGICLIGGAVLSAFLKRFGIRRLTAAAVLVAAANVLLFFVPPGRLARASGYAAVSSIDRRTQSAFETIQRLKGTEPAAILDYRAVITWRHLSYYFPEDYVIVMPENPADVSYVLQHRQTVEVTRRPDRLPGPSRVFLLAPHEDAVRLVREGWRQEGPVYFREVEPGSTISVGPYRLSQPLSQPGV